MTDPRPLVVATRLDHVRRIVAVCSAKGGVGKTLCASVAALALAEAGLRVGLLDLDLQGASCHLVLGVTPVFPREDKGILPLEVTPRLGLMTVAAFTRERALPLRGPEVTDAILELLAVTQWGSLDCLFIDMPPGIGDEVLDLIRLVPRVEILAVSTGSPVSVAVVDRLLAVLAETRVAVAGVVANQCGDGSAVKRMATAYGFPFAGTIPSDPELEERLGKPARLLASGFAVHLRAVLGNCGLPA